MVTRHVERPERRPCPVRMRHGMAGDECERIEADKARLRPGVMKFAKRVFALKAFRRDRKRQRLAGCPAGVHHPAGLSLTRPADQFVTVIAHGLFREQGELRQVIGSGNRLIFLP